MTYQPDQDFFGDVAVNLVVNDGGNAGEVIAGDVTTANTNQAQFVISVTPENDAPTTSPVTLNDINEDAAVMVITASDLLVNAQDIESDTLSVEQVTLADGSQGELTAINATTWHFTPAENFHGNVVFNYVIRDDGTTNGLTDTKTVSGSATVNVLAVNDAPEIDETHLVNTINEASMQQITGLQVQDIDFAGVFADEEISVTLSVSHGSLSVVLPNPTTLSYSTSLSGKTTIQGHYTELNSLLNGDLVGGGVYVDATAISANTIDLTVRVDDLGVHDSISGLSLYDTETHQIDVTPVANTPSLEVASDSSFVRNVFAHLGVSQQGIALVGIVASLTDANETLSLEVTGLPLGARFESANGTVNESGGVWSVDADAISDLNLVDAPIGNHTLSIVAVSEESNGETARSSSVDFTFNIVADNSDLDASAEGVDSWLLASDNSTELTGGDQKDKLEGGQEMTRSTAVQGPILLKAVKETIS
nr:cadherin-like domain-containing protein [Vibrio sonorensis]